MTTTAPSPKQRIAAERAYAAEIIRCLDTGAPILAYDAEKAGAWDPHLHLLLNRYDPNEVELTQASLNAIAHKHPDTFGKLLEEVRKPAKDAPADTVSEIYVPPLPPELITGKDINELLQSVSKWLYEYVQYSTDFSPEAHAEFHLGCAIWVLAVTAARRIQVPLADPVITALSIIMVARTSLFAKTTTAKAAIKLLRAANLGFLLGADETTPQKLLQKMAGHIPFNYGEMDALKQGEVQRRLGFAGQIGWYYDEFNQLLDAIRRPGPMQEFAGLLRKLDNCPETYSYETKAGEDHIEKPYLPLLASTTPANMAKHANKGAEFWHDGMLARMLFFCPDPHAFITQTMEEVVITPPDSLVNALIEWNARLGEPVVRLEPVLDKKGEETGRYTTCQEKPLPITDIRMAPGVREAFAAYRQALRSITKDMPNGDLDGNYGRLPTLALRIAALIASLEHENRITKPVWELAQAITEMSRRNLHQLYVLVATSAEENPAEDLLITFMKQKGRSITVRDVTHYGPPELRRLKSHGVKDLFRQSIEDGLVELDVENDGKGEWYKLVSTHNA